MQYQQRGLTHRRGGGWHFVDYAGFMQIERGYGYVRPAQCYGIAETTHDLSVPMNLENCESFNAALRS